MANLHNVYNSDSDMSTKPDQDGLHSDVNSGEQSIVNGLIQHKIILFPTYDPV